MHPSNADKHRSVLTQTSLGPKKKDALASDYFIQHGKLDPLDFAMNPSLLGRFVSNTGKIMNRAQTQLTWKNQKRVGKAVRRARAMGVMPYFGDWSEDKIKGAKALQRGMWKTGRDSTG
jgi:small subunit ribosomal protein S18